MLRSSRFTLGLVALAFGLVLAGPVQAQAKEKEKVIRSGELSTDGLVDALDIGGPEAPTDAATRGFRPATGPNAAAKPPSPPATGGTSRSGKAPLMITFTTGSAELTPESTAMMSKVAAALQSDRLAGFAFRVEGHADPRGDETANQRLSQARAEAVVKHLIDKYGILAERLTPVGRGSAELYDTVRVDVPENRRVTIVTLRH